MGLREEAALDAREFLEDEDDFGWPLTLRAPDGNSAALTGYSTDIHLVIDPETGQAVSGRQASITVHLTALSDAGLAIPRGVADQNSDPWIVETNDITGAAHTFKVIEALPDRTLGIVACTLEEFKPLGHSGK